MPFQKGHKLAPGGPRPNAGRPTKEEAAEKLSFLQALNRERDRRALRLAKRYYDMAEQDPSTMRHAVDEVRLKNVAAEPAAVIHQFIQFNTAAASNQNPLQLSATTVSAPVLVSDERGREEQGGEGLAPAQREGQDGPQFHSFSNVPAKRR